MAAITPTAVLKENAGSMTLHIATFAATADDGDTWASAIEHIVGYWANGTDDPTAQQSTGIDVSLSGSTFTFSIGEANRSLMLYVLSKS